MENTEITYKDLFETIRKVNGISDIWIKVLIMLNQEFGYSDSALQVLCLYFSFLDVGNTCIKLNKDDLFQKWDRMWKELVFGEESPAHNPVEISILNDGIEELLRYNSDPTVEFPFAIVKNENEDWLFASKYSDAKKTIEVKISNLFSANSKRKKFDSNDNEMSYHSTLTPDNSQKEAIKNGMSKNLIITGGPGTGKTTVVYDILKNLLIKMKDEAVEWSVYLTAPTGKAADRLGKSLAECLEKDTGFKNQAIRSMISEFAENNTSTIHRLLKYSPADNKFNYNSNKQFPIDSVFVIDEASMIDICLFASLLEAIPDEAIVFILGDKNQLPSVDAGAVLGDVLGKMEGTEYTVKLQTCHRVNQNSQDIWKAACIITNENMTEEERAEKFLRFIGSNASISYEEIQCEAEAIKSEIDRKALSAFKGKEFHLASEYCIEYKTAIDGKKQSNADLVFGLTESLKILSAERKGPFGVENLNRTIIQLLNGEGFNPRDFFAGELLMITKNMPILNLFNGDDGLVVKFKDDNTDTLWFMIKKGIEGEDETEEISRNGIFSKDGYTYYPLYQIPRDSIEVSYAITIHKSQGSGYDDILVFMPQDEHHPLVNRQILYTAITRAKKQVTICSSEKVIKEAILNKETRDTMIVL